MNPSSATDANRIVSTAHDRLGKLLATMANPHGGSDITLLERLWDVLGDWAGAPMRAASYDGTGGGSHEDTATERAALQEAADQLATYRPRMVAALGRIEQDVALLVWLRASAVVDGAALDRLIAQAETANGTGDLCACCMLVDHRTGIAWTSDGHRKYRAPKPLQGHLCHWCGEWKANHDGTLPPLDALRTHARGGRVMEQTG